MGNYTIAAIKNNLQDRANGCLIMAPIIRVVYIFSSANQKIMIDGIDIQITVDKGGRMKRILAAAALTASVSVPALAADFQTIGTMGMGGAGVARDMGAYAPYWNPAGLAFAPKSFSTTIGAGVGLRVSEGLADNIDRIAKFTEGNPSTIDKLQNLNTTSADPAAVAEMVSLLTVIDDIQTKKGTLSLNADAGVAFQVKQFGIGLFMLSEGYGRPQADLLNVLPSTTNAGTGNAITAADLVTLAGTPVGSTTFFTAAQTGQLNTALTSAGIASAVDRTNIINALGISLANPANPNLPPVSAQQATDTFVKLVGPAFSGAATNNINNNQTAVMVKNVVFSEVPLSYGHALDLGTLGRLGIGGSFKVVNGRVYQTRIRLIENGASVTSSDIIDGFKDNYEQSTNVTFDLGAQWQYTEWLTVGVVAKNLTSPSFKSPALKDQKGFNVLPDGTPGIFRDADVKLKPQARAGFALTPLSWLSLAADIDLTENESVIAGNDFRNRHLGGGVELNPFTWFKLRGGMYKNLADSTLGNVATAGITLGIPWVQLEIDAAYGLKTAKYKEKEYPRESRAQAQLVMQF